MPADEQEENERGVPARTMEIVVALLLFLGGAIVVFDSWRLGARWGSDGPQSGYFPFYIGILLCIASAATLAQAMVGGSGKLFVTWSRLRPVLTVLVPAGIYVLLVQYIGLYVASAIYIALFMVLLGRYSWLRGIAVGVLLNAGFFLMFEVWFKVPLWKGEWNPLGFLGY